MVSLHRHFNAPLIPTTLLQPFPTILFITILAYCYYYHYYYYYNYYYQYYHYHHY